MGDLLANLDELIDIVDEINEILETLDDEPTEDTAAITDRGDYPWVAKMTEDQVIELRTLYTLGMHQQKLAKKFRISKTQVGRIVRHECWKDGTEDESTPPVIEEIVPEWYKEASAVSSTEEPGDMFDGP